MNPTETPRPFWWPDAQGFAIGAIVFMCGAALFIRMLSPSTTDDKMLDTMITILFSTCLVGVYSYLFGSSRGSAAKDEAQNKIVERLTPPAAPPVPTVDQLGQAALSNGELAYFKTLPDDEAKKHFLAMSAAERTAMIAKV